ncbi:MAG: tetratricopeptide repeat protein [Chthoniobacterales bacterium]
MNISSAIQSPPLSARAQAAAAWIELYLKWKQRLLSWAETLANVWADYWLLILGSFFIVVSPVLKWVQVPFSNSLTGLRLSVLHDPGVMATITPFSAGVLGLLLLVVGIVTLSRFPVVLSLAAAFLITLWAIVPAQIAFREPSLLRRLTYELTVMPDLNVFTRDYLLQNYGTPELIPKRVVVYSAWGRLNAAYSFLRLGWYFFGIGAVLAGIYAVRRSPGDRWPLCTAFYGLPIAAILIISTPAMIGQHYYSRGILAKTQGRNQEAIDDFRTAMRWDEWHAEDIYLYATVGQLQKDAGISFNSPERHINRAVELSDASEYEQSIFEFSQAGEAPGMIGETARQEVARTRMTLGLALYHEGGIGAAVTNWELALAEDPSQIYPLFFLARGYFDLGRYPAGIATAERLAKLINTHSYVLANVYSLTGDCYAKLGDNESARHYYNLSLAADPILNYWAETSLVGY